MIGNKSFHLKYFLRTSIVFFVFSLSVLFFLNADVVFGADEATALWGTESSTVNDMATSSILPKVLKIFSAIIIVLLLAASIYAGSLWVTSEGDEEKIERAQNMLKIAAAVLVFIAIIYFIGMYLIGRFSKPRSGALPQSDAVVDIPMEQSQAIGGCSLQSVFPEPNQKGVQRNVPIILTFNSLANPATMCAAGEGAKICNGEALLTQNVRIFDLKDKKVCENSNAECPSLVKEARVYSRDNKIFTIVPTQYLGSENENVKMAVRLSGAIEKINPDSTRQGMFSSCQTDFFAWQFQLSRNIDLTPPTVKKNGVYPVPDDYADNEKVIQAQTATQRISIAAIAKIKTGEDAKLLKLIAGPKTPDIEVELDAHNEYAGKMRLVVKNKNDIQLELLAAKKDGTRISRLSGGRAHFPGFLTMIVEEMVAPGNFWDLEVASAIKSDVIVINERIFSFVSDVSAANQILYDKEPKNLLLNIAAAIDAREGFDAWSDEEGVIIGLENKLSAVPLRIVSSASGLKIAEVKKEKALTKDANVRDKNDKPRNTVIQISFSEPMNPFVMSGPASDLADYMRVKCLNEKICSAKEPGFFKCGSDVCVDGEFKLSNQGTVVEFISNSQCGVNSCGEPIYCLPAESRLMVELAPSRLSDCGTDNCASKGSFNKCGQDKHCQNASGHFFPGLNVSQALLFNGLSDIAFNSFDGNRDGFSVGASGVFNENSSAGPGDIFSWTFFIGKEMMIRLPEINSIFPAASSSLPLSDKPLIVNFDSLMLSSTLASGQVSLTADPNQFSNLVNLEGINSPMVGYWIMNYHVNYKGLARDNNGYTKMEIRHLAFGEAAKYYASVGSGVKDIYQNCFKPSSSKYCAGEPSCCNEKASGELGCESLKK